ncbi:MAG: family 43 glycosylhydrolase [Tepidisphaeraceae bacterium]
MKTKKAFALCRIVLLLAATRTARAANPIVAGKGLCDPDIRVYGDRAYLYGSHDESADNPTWKMNDWWVWSSADLIHWKEECTLKPQDTYYGQPMTTCWATTAATRNGKYYFYFSRGRDETGVVEGPTPVGPWKDTLGHALVNRASTSTKTPARDPDVFQDEDGHNYLLFGMFDFYLARLNGDMTSLDESPRLLQLDHKNGPIGEGKTDDKPFLHRRGGKYYLSWGCFYAMSDSPYGPYVYKGPIITAERTDPMFRRRLLSDRHGCFFQWRRQWYFACNDLSSPGNTNYFRSTVVSYVHYRANGEIGPINLTRQGVGQYDAKARVIEAENFSAATGGDVTEVPGGFVVTGLSDGDALAFPNVAGLKASATICFRVACAKAGGVIEVHTQSASGPIVGRCPVPDTGGPDHYQSVICGLTNQAGETDLHLVYRNPSHTTLALDWFAFVP